MQFYLRRVVSVQFDNKVIRQITKNIFTNDVVFLFTIVALIIRYCLFLAEILADDIGDGNASSIIRDSEVEIGEEFESLGLELAARTGRDVADHAFKFLGDGRLFSSGKVVPCNVGCFVEWPFIDLRFVTRIVGFWFWEVSTRVEFVVQNLEEKV